MQIDMKNPELVAALNARLIKELGETYAANCALDLMGDALLTQLDQLREQNAALVESNTNNVKLIEELREQINNLRQAPRRAAHGKKE